MPIGVMLGPERGRDSTKVARRAIDLAETPQLQNLVPGNRKARAIFSAESRSRRGERP